VLATIYLDDQLSFTAQEIDHVGSKWRLSYELEPGESPVS